MDATKTNSPAGSPLSPPNITSNRPSGNTTPAVSAGVGTSKEHEGIGSLSASIEKGAQISVEPEIPKEVEVVGVKSVPETVEIPPDVKNLGVTQPVSSQQISSMTLPQITLPISDGQVVAGLHADFRNAVHWLALWCVRRLQKAHVMLKRVHGKIVRVNI